MLPLLRFRLLELTFRSDLLDAIPDPSLVPNPRDGFFNILISNSNMLCLCLYYGLELVWYLCVVYIPAFFAKKAESFLEYEIQVRNLEPCFRSSVLK